MLRLEHNSGIVGGPQPVWRTVTSLRSLLPVLVLLLATPLWSPAKPRWVIKPPPPWVEPANTGIASNKLSGDAQSGIQYLLSDHQFRITSSGAQRYFRWLRKVLSAAGLESVSQIKIDFEPTYQELVIHHVHIIRGGVTIDVLRPGDIRIIQQESELSERLYNGTLSAVLFLNDIRSGDTIDCAYSVNGDNPVMGGRFTDSFLLGSSQPIQELRFRLLWPAHRKLHFRTQNLEIQPSVRSLQNEMEYKWERNNVPASEYEDEIPTWFDPAPRVYLSEFSSWEDVARWAAPLYEIKQPVGAVLSKKIERWKTELPRQEERVLAATHFVQDEVRYLGIELGSYSHLPRDPSSVFKKRFGDCKDKSLLLSTMLNLLGVEAHPALVNTDAQPSADELLPSPSAFDHVIVQATLDGKTYWIDPTLRFQRGGLSQHPNPPYRRALVLRDGIRAMEEILESPGDLPLTSVKDLFTVVDYKRPVSYSVVTTYRGAAANRVRSNLAEQSISELSRNCLSYYSDTYPNIEADGSTDVQDDTTNNIVVITERYRIPDLWSEESRTFRSDRIIQELSKPEITRRTMPLSVPYPVNVSQSIEIRMPETIGAKNKSGSLKDEAVRFDYEYEQSGSTIKLNYSLRTLADHIPTANVAQHLELLDRIKGALGYTVSTKTIGEPSDALVGGIILAGGGVVLLALFMGRIVKRVSKLKRLQGFKRSQRIRVGAGAEDAITVTSKLEIGRHLGRIKCSCGGPYYEQGEPLPQQEGGMLNGRPLIVVELECKLCRNRNDVYFVQLQT